MEGEELRLGRGKPLTHNSPFIPASLEIVQVYAAPPLLYGYW